MSRRGERQELVLVAGREETLAKRQWPGTPLTGDTTGQQNLSPLSLTLHGIHPDVQENI